VVLNILNIGAAALISAQPLFDKLSQQKNDTARKSFDIFLILIKKVGTRGMDN
jgi:hypothetical protein